MLSNSDIGIKIKSQDINLPDIHLADIYLQSFTLMTRLVLFHGYDAATEMANFIEFYFYKNVVYTACEVCFNWNSGFSNLPFFLWILQNLYNLVFTTLPPILLMISIRVYIKSKIDETVTPEVYLATKLRHERIGKVFILWLIRGCFHGMVVTTVILNSFTMFTVDGVPYDTSYTDSSTLVYSTVLLVVYAKLSIALYNTSVCSYVLSILFTCVYVGLLSVLQIDIGPLDMRYIARSSFWPAEA